MARVLAFSAGVPTTNESLALLKAMPLVNSGVELEVSWKDPIRHVWNTSALAQLVGRPIVLKIQLQHCKLYALVFMN